MYVCTCQYPLQKFLTLEDYEIGKAAASKEAEDTWKNFGEYVKNKTRKEAAKEKSAFSTLRS